MFFVATAAGGFEIFWGNYLQLGEGETTTGTNTAVVLDGGAANDGTQLVDGAGGNSGRLSDTGLTTTVLPAGLCDIMLVPNPLPAKGKIFSSRFQPVAISFE